MEAGRHRNIRSLAALMVAIVIGLGACAGHRLASAARRSSATRPTVGTPVPTSVPAWHSVPSASTTPTITRPAVRATSSTALPPTTPARRTTITLPPACPSSLANQLAATGGGSQLMTVEAPTAGSTSATVTLWQRRGTCWSPAAGPWPARVGRNGLSSQHREGDGTTPVGDYGISPTVYGIASDPGVHGGYHQLECGDWWDEDPASQQYNTFQHVACGTTPPFGRPSEALWQATTAYQRFAVILYNSSPVIAGAGSGIFLHDDLATATNGCVSLAPGNLDTLLRWLQPGQLPHVVIGKSSDIRQF